MTVDLSFRGRQSASRRIEDFYTDLHGAMYDLAPLDDAPFPSAREFRQFLAETYPGGMRGLQCLDAGCGGTAINSRSLIAASAARVLAVDLNKASLALVRTSLAGRARGTLEMACASLLDLPFPAGAFDFAVCSGVVHHTPDPERALQELRRVMKPRARAYVSAYCFEGSVMHGVVRIWRAAAHVIPFALAHGLFKRSTVVNNFVLDHMYVPILWIYRAADFSAMLERSGFVVDRSAVSAVDSLHDRRIGPWSLTGDGLLRVFMCSAA
jgi:ubiquinone/menaquinone biosynthesis C-methylase UbiE